MKYKNFKQNILIAVDFNDLSLEDIEEQIQELYITWGLNEKNYLGNFVGFCEEHIEGTKYDSCMWLSDRGIAILKLMQKVANPNPRSMFPIAGKR